MNGNLPILYSIRRCPYAIRARMALCYSGIRVELREVVLSNKPTDFLAVSPKGTVPDLTFDGEVVEESLDIMLWCLERNDPKGWLEDIEEAKALIEINDTLFKPHLDGYKYAGKNSERVKQIHRSAAEEVIADLDVCLANRSFLLGNEPSLPDFALMPFIRQFANVDLGWFEAQPYPQLQRWLRVLLGSEIFIRAMVKYRPWERGDSVTVF